MIVFVLTNGDWESEDVVGVFESVDAAKAEADSNEHHDSQFQNIYVCTVGAADTACVAYRGDREQCRCAGMPWKDDFG